MSSESSPADQAHHRIWVTDLLLLLMATIWGINFSVVKFGTQAIALGDRDCARLFGSGAGTQSAGV